MPSFRRALLKIPSIVIRRPAAALPASSPDCVAASRMSLSVIDAYQTSMRRIPA